MQAKQSKKQKHTKIQPRRFIKQGKTRYKRQGKTKTPIRSVCKPNRRSTEVALIYSANAKQKRFEGYLAVLQAPSKVYKSNHKLDPQRSRQFVDKVNPLCGQRRPLLAQIGSSNNRITLRCKFLITINQLAKKAYLKSNTIVRREDGAPVSLLQQIRDVFRW